MNLIYPVILAGGSGTRLWPLSRAHFPKQFIILPFKERSLFQEACLRFNDRTLFAVPTIVTHEEHRFIVRQQLRTIGINDATIITEPIAKGTTIACLAAASFIKHSRGNVPIIFSPADHVIEQPSLLHATLQSTYQQVADGALCIFGITPTRPESGYGYILPGEQLSDTVFTVASFIEKPEKDKALEYIAQGALWNSGLYYTTPDTLQRQIALYAPEFTQEMADPFKKTQSYNYGYHMLSNTLYEAVPNISIDTAITEHSRNVIVAMTQIDWQDLGSWEALYDGTPKDSNGNVTTGDILAINTRNSYVESTSRLVTVYGLDDIGVIETDDAVAIFPIHESQAMKTITNILTEASRKEIKHHTAAERPWGSYTILGMDATYQAKKITILPEGELSLQRHSKRAEHWVVVSGEVIVTKEDNEFILKTNESTYIPIGTVHKLRNTSEAPCVIIEIQTGTYFGEDDIERLSDTYGRA